jgi:putative zinc finger protein
MPSELSEPTLDELSAYVDDALDPAAKARVAQHITGCAECGARVDGLRQTANLVRALPMESPPRTFSIPLQRQQASRRWVPAAWLGSAAAALLVIVVGVSQLHLPGSPTSLTTGSRNDGQNGALYGSEGAAGAPAAGQDRAAQALKAAGGNPVTVVDPRNNGRRLTVATDRASYPANGRMVVTGLAEGGSTVGQVRIVLRRGNYGVQLGQPDNTQAPNQLSFKGSYELAPLPLMEPRAGSYTLTVTWTDGSGATLIAELPVMITG